MLTHKLGIILTKIFLFNTFYQCPVALLITFALMGVQVSSNAAPLTTVSPRVHLSLSDSMTRNLFGILSLSHVFPELSTLLSVWN